MSAFKGTPGPWAVCSGINAADRPGIEAPGFRLSIVVYGTDDDEEGVFGRTGQEAEANARLIAAAPDLLEALQDALCALECCGKDFPAATKASAAIAKATGGTA